MWRLLCICFALHPFFAAAQNSTSPAFDVTKTYSPQLLAQYLTANDTTDLQRITSLFTWITQNIAYNTKRFDNNYNNRYVAVLDDEEEADSLSPLKPLYERVAIQVLKRRTAVCGGYANLFKALCSGIGIPCEVVTGLGKVSPGRIDKRFTSNHRWNAVFADTAWHLLDATWASGYINYRNEFQQFYNPVYFFADPAEFIKDHYPEDQRWALLPQPPVLTEFMFSPFKTTAFNRFYIKSFSPAAGIINARPGDSITFEIEAERPETIWVSDIRYTDSNTVKLMQCCGASKPVNKRSGKKVSYTYQVFSPGVEWLHIIFDDEIILRYKLNIISESLAPPPPAVDTVIYKH
ncbi:hypothetical protein I5907_08060 [Panacibacter sp. DH6]|uniref:Transglutaminase-like domain-containing protein n=1 Tax=Panacibacter microcysteis TaxID=2793269 RepID=A0A931E264_9BACT|nr:transglutaminase domain-containing protein [Panacibacter microcysteis]MBG9376185.1 hypothetical protein [Panacibacter microcysteis]